MEATKSPERAFEKPADDVAATSIPLGPRERQAIDEVLVQTHSALVAKATRMLKRLHILPVQCEAEDAVDGAVLRLSRSANRQTLASADRASLLKLLSAILTREIFDLRDYLARRKRNGEGTRRSETDELVGETVFRPGEQPDRGSLRQVVDPEQLTSSGLGFEAQVIADDQFELLLNRLGDPSLRDIARMRLEDYSREEIAAEFRVTTRTIQRKMAIIREAFEGLDPEWAQAEQA
jgi:DNA-directed RNA polymerase specialized sigma24 family protein